MNAQKKNIKNISHNNTKSQFYGLDEIGILGTQERKSARSEATYNKRVGDIFREVRKDQHKSGKV